MFCALEFARAHGLVLIWALMFLLINDSSVTIRNLTQSIVFASPQFFYHPATLITQLITN